MNRSKKKPGFDRVQFGTDLLSHITAPKPSRRPVPSKPTIDPAKAVWTGLGEQTVRLKDRFNWSYEVCVAASLYLRALVLGEGSIEATAQALNTLDRRVRAEIEKCFARECWFKHGVLNDTTLPGMDQPWFQRHHNSAMARWPKSPSRVLVSA